MRLPMFAAAFALAATPVPALANDAETHALSEAAAVLADPDRQDQVALMASAVLGMVMEMPVGPLARAGAEMAGEDPEAIDPDMRVADMVGSDAQEISGEVSRQIPQMMDRMSHMTVALEAMLPHLRTMVEGLKRDVPFSAE